MGCHPCKLSSAFSPNQGWRVFNGKGGGGVNRAPKSWGGGGAGVWEKGSIDRTINQSITKSGAEGADNFLTIENVQFFSPNPWKMMILNPLDALIPNIPFSFFAEFRVRITYGARGSVSVPSPPRVVPHSLSFPGGGWGTVTWSTQNFSLRLIVLLCGWLCCGALPLASLALMAGHFAHFR